MAIQVSTGLSNAMLATGALRTALANGVINIYAGTIPASADEALGAASLLVTISLNSSGNGINFATSATNRVISKAAEVWSGVNVYTGVATFYRHVVIGDTGAASTTQKRLQGTAGASGTDMVLASGTLIAGETTVIDAYSVSLPSA